jgi:hypothetical protein
MYLTGAELCVMDKTVRSNGPAGHSRAQDTVMPGLKHLIDIFQTSLAMNPVYSLPSSKSNGYFIWPAELHAFPPF